jgi:hypothetical protein
MALLRDRVLSVDHARLALVSMTKPSISYMIPDQDLPLIASSSYVGSAGGVLSLESLSQPKFCE